MDKNVSLQWPAFLYGGDYNPDQWPREVWTEDMHAMGEAGWNVATLPVFGWAALEPEEGRFTFEWLDDILDRMAAKGIRACFATATASVPAWLPKAYPDVLRVERNGVRQKHGNRHTFCPNSPNYRRLSTTLARKLAERYANHPALLLWHVNNEYGSLCYCDQCAAAFRVWLRNRYGSLDALNERWYTSFWGHTFTDWTQIEPPTEHGEGAIQALNIDYHRFQSESIFNCYKAEKDILKEITPDVPVTTNLMGTFFNLDYYQWAKEMDIVSWDNYPAPEFHYADIAFVHAVMRGLKGGQPFLLMEQTPSQQNWQPFCRLKGPGVLNLLSMQAVAHGADSVMYFQWRRGRGGIEKLHGAVLEHGGNTQNRVFREVASIGHALANTGTRLQNARVPAKVAVLYDWPNRWGLHYSSGPLRDIPYRNIVRDTYKSFARRGIAADVVSPESDLSKYDLIVAPMLTMLRQPDADKISALVENGATLVATAFSGLVDETDMVYLVGAPGPWRKTLGVFVEETDAISPTEPNLIQWSDGATSEGTLLCDLLQLEGAEVVGTYTRNFYAGQPAITRNAYGKGSAYYVATQLDDAGLDRLFGEIEAKYGITSPLAGGALPPETVEVSQRVTPSGELHLYFLNHGEATETVELPAGTYTDLLTNAAFDAKVELAPRATLVLVRDAE